MGLFSRKSTASAGAENLVRPPPRGLPPTIRPNAEPGNPRNPNRPATDRPRGLGAPIDLPWVSNPRTNTATPNTQPRHPGGGKGPLKINPHTPPRIVQGPTDGRSYATAILSGHGAANFTTGHESGAIFGTHGSAASALIAGRYGR